jgi:Na+-translocating ferredoxin:NAD+ oxidoreductase RnfG subunit
MNFIAQARVVTYDELPGSHGEAVADNIENRAQQSVEGRHIRKHASMQVAAKKKAARKKLLADAILEDCTITLKPA